MKQQIEIKESFSWVTPEWQTLPLGPKSIKIKGVALPSDAISRNKRKYVREEIKRAARTLSGKPITINHNDNRIVGNVIHAEYENGAIEYIGQIKKEPYVTMLRTKDPRFRGVSVQAGYLHNRCVHCGERFFSEQDFKSHMQTSHSIVDGVKEVHGIIFDALSLVVDPEVPGVEGATAELWETLKASSPLQLLEIVTTEKKQVMEYQKKMKKLPVAITREKRVVAKPPKIKEQDEEPCPDGQHRNEEGECVADEPKVEEQEQTQQEQPEPTVKPASPCPEGFEDDGQGGCKPKEWQAEPTAKTPAPLMVPTPTVEPAKTPSPAPPAPAAAAGPVIEQDESQLAPAPFPTTPPEVPAITGPCEEGSHWDKLAGTCVPDEATPTEVTDLVKEFRLPPLLKLAEPCDWSKAGYSSFNDCVSKNQDKGDPEAYCADIKRKVGGETFRETYDPEKSYIRSVRATEDLSKIAKTLNEHNEAIAKLAKAVTTLPATYNRPITTEAKLRAQAVKHGLNYIAKLFAETNQKQTNYFAEMIKNLNENSRKSDATIIAYAEKLGENTRKNEASLATYVKKLSEQLNKTVESQKVDKAGYEKVLNNQQNIISAIDDKYKTEFKTLEQRVKEQEEELEKRKCGENEHYDEEKGECVPNTPEQTEETKKKLEETLTRVTNLEAKLKGQFKGQSKPISTDEPSSSSKKLAKTMRSTAKE